MSDQSSFPFGLSPWDVIPSQYQNVSILTYRQLVYLGSKNLTHYKTHWENILTEVDQIRDFLQEVVDLLTGKTIADLQALALQYDNPFCEARSDTTDPQIGLTAPYNRAPGSTTLNLCEWCRYAVPKDFPYVEYYTPADDTRVYRPSCGIMDYRWNIEFHENRSVLCPLTHCHFQNAPDLHETLQNARHNLQQYQEFHQITTHRILYLNHALTDAEPKPIFPDYRQLTDYPIGTPTYFLNHSTFSDDLAELHRFQPIMHNTHCHLSRNIVTGYQKNEHSPDQFIITDARKDVQDQIPDTITCQDARLISIEDLIYLTDHPSFFQHWYTSIKKSNGYKSILEAITIHHELGYIP